MKNTIFPVFETVEFLRIVSYGEGKKGKFAVGLVQRAENEYTTLFPHEEFPIEKLQQIKEGQLIKVQPTQGGLRARLKDQDFELITQNQEDIACEICKIHNKLDNFENRLNERFDALDWAMNQIRKLLVWFDTQQNND